MRILSCVGFGVMAAAAFIVHLGDIRMFVGCIFGAGIIILDLACYLERESK